MGRPQKEGLDYFPLDVDIDQDDKIALIEAQHGIVGFGVVIKLFMKIYKNGYFYEWGEKEQLLFSKRVNVDINSINAIINDCLKWGLFDPHMYETYGILTSRGIQRRYFEAVSRRQNVTAIEEYCLIDMESYSNIVYVNINGINVNGNSHSRVVNDNINPQSKVKESKVKERRKEYICASTEGDHVIEKDSEGRAAGQDSDHDRSDEQRARTPFRSLKQQQRFDAFWEAYPRKRSKGQAEKTWVKINPDDDLLEEILAGLENAKRSVDWQKDGGQYIPYPATWLNAKGWEDELPVSRDSPTAQKNYDTEEDTIAKLKRMGVKLEPCKQKIS